MRVIIGLQSWQSVEGEPQTDRRVSGNQEQPPTPELPGLAQPARSLGRGESPPERQDVADRLGEPAFHGLTQAGPGSGLIDRRIVQLEVRRQVGFGLDEVERILTRGQDVSGVDSEPFSQPPDQGESLGGRGPGLAPRRGFGRHAAPDGQPVAPPEEAQGPARQGLARIPLALSEVQHAARCKPVLEPLDQRLGHQGLGRPRRIGVPLCGLEVVDRDEGRLAAEGQAHVVGNQVRVDPFSQRIQGDPVGVLERPGDADRLDDARDAHLELEGRFRLAGHAADGGRRAVVGRRGEREVSLAAQKPRGGVKADPSCAGDIGLRPGV